MNPTIHPPSFPLRPVNGGPLPKARAKHGRSIYEPKVNGWRAWLHTPTGTMFNRENERLSIEREFTAAARQAASHPPIHSSTHPDCFEWLDVEAFSRRHKYGQGALVILDAPGVPGIYDERQQAIYDRFVPTGAAGSWKFVHEPPPENRLLTFAYGFTDYGLAAQGKVWDERADHFQGEDVDGIHTGWVKLQRANQQLGAEVFEGMVAKRTDSLYPLQLQSATREFPFWIKHRWAF